MKEEEGCVSKGGENMSLLPEGSLTSSDSKRLGPNVDFDTARKQAAKPGSQREGRDQIWDWTE